MVTVDYTPPVEGGKMKLNSNLLGQFPKLVDFFCVKKELVELLEELNQKNNISIIPSKISQFLKEVKGKSNKECVQHCCTHTLVTHRVGYHYDFFDTNSSGIENKVLVVSEGKGGKKDGSCPSLGRGGGGPGVFTYAILDW